MVAAQQEEVLGVLDLVGEQEGDDLEPVLPTIHVVAQEQVVGVRREAAVLEEPEEVMVLAMDVADDLDRRLQLKKRRLVDEHSGGLFYQIVEVIARQLTGRAGLFCGRKGRGCGGRAFLRSCKLWAGAPPLLLARPRAPRINERHGSDAGSGYVLSRRASSFEMIGSTRPESLAMAQPRSKRREHATRELPRSARLGVRVAWVSKK